MDEWELTTGHDVARWCHILWNVWGLALPVAYLAGLTLLKRQFHQEASGLSPTSTPKHYLALSPDEATPSALFDAEHELQYGESNMSQTEISKEFESEVPLLNRH
ncbi:hypothetical protein VKT23_003969 [Stygiomarasmius scandens]|uniref:Uncharacterized protein n=1 Tax=Marasmiellus scandens TaxID=2682957 RepID=A0ABR1JTJ2_9AGAR